MSGVDIALGNVAESVLTFGTRRRMLKGTLAVGAEPDAPSRRSI
jgi:hypothetical protein